MSMGFVVSMLRPVASAFCQSCWGLDCVPVSRRPHPLAIVCTVMLKSKKLEDHGTETSARRDRESSESCAATAARHSSTVRIGGRHTDSTRASSRALLRRTITIELPVQMIHVKVREAWGSMRYVIRTSTVQLASTASWRQ